ncbi:MAG TPA: thioredoxin [Myxococcota bacterium]|nr:thioredoxin [Myxococcota bacterium]HQK51023.1 thioredoxin [Myxococcota bacterium]
MALLDERSRKAVRELFEEGLDRPVHVDLYAGEANPEEVAFSRELLAELHDLDPRVTWSEHALDEAAKAEGIDASPVLVIGRDLGYRIEYWGAPLGLEARGFLDVLTMVSKGDSGLSEKSRTLLSLVDRPVRVHAFVTPSCPHCPQSVMLNARMAVESKGRVRAIAVEAYQNPDLAARFGVSSVPQQVIDEDETTTTIGTQKEAAMVRQVALRGTSDPAAVASLEVQWKASGNQALPESPDHPVELGDDSFDEALGRYPLMVVDFWAEWCMPCRMVAPVVHDLASEMKGKVVFGKLDTDANQEIASRYAVHSIPSLIVFRDGREVDRIVGARSKAQLRQEIERHLPQAD